ncbi:hypothetical protein EV715DRAFT_298328 [Schizophyllum commune]
MPTPPAAGINFISATTAVAGLCRRAKVAAASPAVEAGCMPGVAVATRDRLTEFVVDVVTTRNVVLSAADTCDAHHQSTPNSTSPPRTSPPSPMQQGPLLTNPVASECASVVNNSRTN